MTVLFRRLLLLLALCVVLATPVIGASVASTFQLALRAFQRGDNVTTIRILRVIQKKYPEHQPSAFLMGRALYRMGKPKQALPYFRRAGDFMHPAGAFEYGIAFFSTGSCSRAMRGFTAVPRDHAYRDLAQFYTGVCLYRARRYDAAEQMLRRARVLPNNLAATKRELLTFIERQQAAERGGRSTSAPSFAPIPLPMYAFPSYAPPPVYHPPVDRPPVPGKKSRDEIVKPAPVVTATASGFSATITPGVNVIRRGTQSEKHGSNFLESGEEGVVGNLDSRLRFDFAGTNQPAALLGAKLDVSNKNFKNSEIRYVTYEDDPSNTVVPETLRNTVVNSKFWAVTLTPGLNIPLASSASIETNLVYYRSALDMKLSNKTSYFGPQARLSMFLDPVSISLMISNYGFKNIEGQDVGRDTRIEGNASVNFGDYKLTGSLTRVSTNDPAGAIALERMSGFESRMILAASIKRSWETLSLTLTGSQYTQTPPANTNVSGTHDETRAEISVDKSFAFGASVVASGLFTKIGGYIRDGLVSAEQDESGAAVLKAASATGGRQGFSVTGKLTPIEWGFVSASYSRYQWKFDVQQPELAAQFQQNVIDFITEYVINVGVAKSF